MATYEEMQAALIQAHKSGNTDHANRIAGMMKQQPKVSPDDYNPILEGALDPIHGAAQLLENITPEPIRKGINNFNNFLADKGVPLAKVPEGGLNQSLAERETQIQSARAQAGESGFDGKRLIGNIVSPANISAISKIPQVVSLTGKIATGAGLGAFLSALNPVTEGDYFTQKGKQAAIGAVGGGAIPVLGQGLSRVITPKTGEYAKEILKRGITVTPGQILGGSFKKIEEALTSVPLVGDAIKSGQIRGIKELNLSLFNETLGKIGASLPKGTAAGNRAVNYTREAFDKAYNSVNAKITGNLDDGFVSDLSKIRSLAESTSKKARKEINQIIDDTVMAKFTRGGKIAGETVKEIESELGRISSTMLRSERADIRKAGTAAKELQASLRRMIERQNPEAAKELSAINSAYGEFKILQDAASRTGAKEGIFTPAHLRAAVRKADKSKDKARFSEGEARLQTIATAADETLSSRLPNSGTIDRGLVNWLAIGGLGYFNPSTLLAGAAASVPYLPGGNKLASSLLSGRQFAKPVADFVEKGSPYLIPAVPAAGQGLLNR